MKRRMLSMMMAVVMVLSMLPVSATAADRICTHHVHDDQCGYVEAVEAVACTHVHDENCSGMEDESACIHVHDESCGYVEAVEGAPCGYECPICPVQGLIDALPDPATLSSADAEAMDEQMQAVTNAIGGLAPEDQAQLDLTRYYAVVEALAGEQGKPEAAVDITVTPSTGASISLEVEPTDKIEDIKEKLQNEGITLGSLELVYEGKLLENGNTLQDYSIQKNSTIYLVSENEIQTITITADPDTGGSVTGAGKYRQDTGVSITATANEGYFFAGWEAADGTFADASAAATTFTVPDTDVAITAKFTANDSTTYTVTFNLNGKDGTAPAAQTVASGGKATVPDPAPTREGYTFAGWYTSEDNGTTLSETAYDFNTAVTADITLYAKWTEVVVTEVILNLSQNQQISVYPTYYVVGGERTETSGNVRYIITGSGTEEVYFNGSGVYDITFRNATLTAPGACSAFNLGNGVIANLTVEGSNSFTGFNHPGIQLDGSGTATLNVVAFSGSLILDSRDVTPKGVSSSITVNTDAVPGLCNSQEDWHGANGRVSILANHTDDDSGNCSNCGDPMPGAKLWFTGKLPSSIMVEEKTLTATVSTHDGGTAVLQWYVNDEAQDGQTATTFSVENLNLGDVVHCTATYNGETKKTNTCTVNKTVAKIVKSDETVVYYDSFSTAASSAANGDTLVLLTNVSGGYFRYDSGNITLDLNGCIWTTAHFSLDAVSLTVKSSKNGGKIQTGNVFFSNGTMTLESGTIEQRSDASLLMDVKRGSFFMTGGEISTVSDNVTFYIGNNGTVSLSGGKFSNGLKVNDGKVLKDTLLPGYTFAVNGAAASGEQLNGTSLTGVVTFTEVDFYMETNLPAGSMVNKELTVKVVSSSGKDISYQWYKDSTAISGATEATYTPAEEGNYYCAATCNGTRLTSKTCQVKSYGVMLTRADGTETYYDSWGDMQHQLYDESGSIKITLLKNASITWFERLGGYNALELDLNGCVLTVEYHFDVNKPTVITDSVGTGGITFADSSFGFEIFSFSSGSENLLTLKGGTYTNGISINPSYSQTYTLASILGDGYGYYQNGELITLTEGQTEISGSVTVKKISVHSHDDVSYTAWTATSGTVTSGNYYLNDNFNVTDDITISGNVTLCLNGKTLDMGEKSIKIDASNTLTVCDCQTAQGAISNVHAQGSFYDVDGTLNITGGNINGRYYAINIGDGTANISGGVISGNEYAVSVGANGTLNVSGTAKVSANVYGAISNRGTVNLTGGSLTSTKGHAFNNQGGGKLYLSGNPSFEPKDGEADISFAEGSKIYAQSNASTPIAYSGDAVTIETAYYVSVGDVVVYNADADDNLFSVTNEGYILAQGSGDNAEHLVLAEEAESYNLWVGGVEVTEDNYNNIQTGVTYDPNSNTLTLTNATVSHPSGPEGDDPANHAAIVYMGNDTLTIHLAGTNTVTSTGYGSTGIRAQAGSLTITGDSVTVKAGNGESPANYGLYAAGTMDIQANRVLVVTDGMAVLAGNASVEGYTITGSNAPTDSPTDSVHQYNGTGYVTWLWRTVPEEGDVGNAAARSLLFTKPITTYSITVTNDGNGTASSNLQSAESGTEITLTAVPNDGYVFKQWEILAGNVQITNNKFTMPSGNVSVKAVFEVDTQSPAHIAVTGITLGGNSVNVNADLTLVGTVTPGNATNKDIVWRVVNANGTGATITNGVFRATAAGTATIRATIADGTAAGTDYMQDFTITVVPFSYVITTGNEQTVTKGNAASFTSNALFSKFLRVEVDGKTVDSSNYTAVSGSTKVTLKAAYIETLSAGEHTLTIVSTDGSASTTFTVKNPSNPDVPETGDETKLGLWLGMMMLAVCGIGAVCFMPTKKKDRYSR